jgi:hypothetical protein
MKSENNIWEVVNKSFKQYSPAFHGLKTTEGIEKDSKKIVDTLADHYEKNFPYLNMT